VRHGLNDFKKHNFNTSKLHDITNFVQNQQLCRHKLIDDVSATWLTLLNTYNLLILFFLRKICFEPTGIRNEQMSVRIEIPKKLGGIF
jgi:hypothetical protein